MRCDHLWMILETYTKCWSGNVLMLARSNRPLPLEIYYLIYSHLELQEIAPLLRTCHALFNVTVAHVWHEVVLDAVLNLLPGCISGEAEVWREYSARRDTEESS